MNSEKLKELQERVKEADMASKSLTEVLAYRDRFVAEKSRENTRFGMKIICRRGGALVTENIYADLPSVYFGLVEFILSEIVKSKQDKFDAIKIVCD